MIAGLVSAILISVISDGRAGVLYAEDFEGPVGVEWSSTATDLTPVGVRRFLGQFHNSEVTLTLAALPTHQKLRLEFELFVIRSWDGNTVLSVGALQGPDVWTLNVDGVQAISSTFSNIEDFDGVSFQQAWPGDIAFDATSRTETLGARSGDTYLASGPSGSPGNHAPRTGAAEVNSLGYDAGTGVDPMDSVYRIALEFAHENPTISFAFSANLAGSILPPLADETWGLDNVVVTAVAVPAPGSFAVPLLAVPLVLNVLARRRRNQAVNSQSRYRWCAGHCSRLRELRR